MPLILPNTAAGPVAGDAVVAAGGRGRVGAVAVVVAREMNSQGRVGLEAASPPQPALKCWAPISFWLHIEALKPSPGVHLPCQPGICW